MNAQDYALWREYVAVEVARFYDHCDGETYIWQNTPEADRLVGKLGSGEKTPVVADGKIVRWDYSGGDAEAAAFAGPWHVIQRHLTTEFRQWVKEHWGTQRLTPSDWRKARIAERAEIAFTESADYTLGELETLRRLTGERDALIVEAAKRGAAKTAIARAVGLSRQQIHTIVAAAELAPVTPIRPDVEIAPTIETRMLADGTVVEVF